MPQTTIIVHDVHVHPDTGHTTYTLKSETTNGNAKWTGPLRQYGIDRQALRDRFNDSIDEFEAHIAIEHRPFCGVHPADRDALVARKGKTLATISHGENGEAQ
jgi:hypothetical protein